MQIKNVQKTECCVEEIPKRTLRSPRLSGGKTLLRNTRTRSQIPNESKQNHETSSFVCKLETEDDSISVSKILDTKCDTPCLKVESLKEEMLEQNSNGDELSIIKPAIHLVASTPSSIIQQKLQMALEESRKSKPSIFIVQALECKKEQVKSLDNLHSTTTAISEEEQLQTTNMNNERKKSLKLDNKFNKNHIKQGTKTRKGKNYPTFKRRLRKRKIIVIKTIKPKQKSYASLHEIKRELRSSPRINENNNRKSLVNNQVNNNGKYAQPNKTSTLNEAKSYRTVHTETKDLEIYLDKQNNQTKTRLMAKASALLERSRMTLRGNCNTSINKSKLTSQIQRSKLSLHGTRTQILRPRLVKATSEKRKFKTTSSSTKLLYEPVKTNKTLEHTNIPKMNLLENENVVVSSTTNTFDERPTHEPLPTASPITLKSLHNAASYVIASSPIQTKDQFTQCNTNSGVQYLNTSPLPTQTMRNPLKSDYGVVLHIYHE
ncbi:tubulin-specific chaperone C, partial [Lucilia cuprina]|uniref:tubulin-specific chaperone C n=1 Tax=Lucilia cuprina TaxID=7375 RepID=UPI001F06B859